MGRSTNRLQLGPKLTVPVDIASEAVALLGQRGSGKSNACVVAAEELWRCGVPWVAVDPKGDWWGIRADAAGTGPGLPIPVFGGLHGDLPLETGAGAFIADLLVDQNLTAVLDCSHLSGGETSRFLTDFFRRLFRRHQTEPHVRTVMAEEAHRYIPQQVSNVTAELKEAAARLVLEGRAFGLGMWAASQRSSRIHKDVLTQIGTMFAMRSPSKLDRDAIAGWVAEHGAAKELLDTIPSLPAGEGWLWSPEYLGMARPERVVFRRRWTFDSGATPKVGQKRATPRTIADIDLAAVKEAMAETIERVRADDPAELRRRIRDLERQVGEARAATPEPAPVYVPDPALVAELREALDPASEAWRRLASLDELVGKLRLALEEANGRGAPGAEPPPVRRGRPARGQERPDPPARREPSRAPAPPEAEGGDIGAGERKILTAIAQQRAGATREELTVLTGYKRSSRDTYIGRLRARELIVVEDGRLWSTDAGVAALGDTFEPLPTGRALREYWLDRLGGGERAILGVLIDAYPDGVHRDDISELTGYKRSSRDTYLGRLRARQLIVVDDGDPRASAALF